ncbi:kinase-like protein [Rickenella mellea]|uniref:Kinase-like protein n=1 Tax=Rickenella mellea TaxID=50990 RepID=A0A4Y7QHQ3_9AGAM|nr:kinase-like protein [Rickenella mellea]
MSRHHQGWIADVLAPLEEFIDGAIEPRVVFTDLTEIAEGESGLVYAARVVNPTMLDKSHRRTGKGNKIDASMVAIKCVPLAPSGSQKLNDLRRELMLMYQTRHTNILSMDGLYVDVVEDSLWIRMELMERSLADILALAEEGLIIQEEVIARFASDILQALTYMEGVGIAHRDVRSDNLLVNSNGILKIADFSNAVLVDPSVPLRTESVGVIYWQAPEMRSGSYDARKVDVWSAGATAWEMAESEPPFVDYDDPAQIPDSWPELSQPEIYSRSFHDFLHLCSQSPDSRPSAAVAAKTPFIRSACARIAIVNLLAECKNIEEKIHRRQSVESQGTVTV